MLYYRIMPELPEVETIKRGLAPLLVSQQIRSVKLNRLNLRYPFPSDFAKRLTGRTIVNVDRRAKYLKISLDDGNVLVAHLGMTGKFIFNKSQANPKHHHVEMEFLDGRILIYNDPRRFGYMELCANIDIDTHHMFKHLGPEPLSDQFNTYYLSEALKHKKAPIKTVIMDQSIVVGVGNIYACEALFKTNISPTLPSNLVSKNQIKKLVNEIKFILDDAIKSGGSTLKDFAHVNGDSGYFQHKFLVYGRDGQNCYTCNTKIKRIVQTGRATFYCSNCQCSL